MIINIETIQDFLRQNTDYAVISHDSDVKQHSTKNYMLSYQRNPRGQSSHEQSIQIQKLLDKAQMNNLKKGENIYFI